MNRRTLLLGGGALAASLGGLTLLRPDDHGQPYDSYFHLLNAQLRTHGPGKPLLLIDADRLNANIQRVRALHNPQQQFRIVAKSLPSPKLLERVMDGMQTRRLMVFHQPHINALTEAFPNSDLLLGKPLPVQSAATFYASYKKNGFDPEQQLTWLVDSRERLEQYAQLARSLGTTLRISLEIDVGLHRGGLQNSEELAALLPLFQDSGNRLKLTGLMGYDAHVGKIPSLIESRAASLEKSQQRYRLFQESLFAAAPESRGQLVMNGAGSPTFRLHRQNSPLNEVSAGSCFLKPSDFDLDLLADLEPAAWIATPVLKTLENTTLPGLEKASHFWRRWDRNRQQSFFVYGGLWMAKPVSPAGLEENPLYGKSTNQAIFNGSHRISLRPDDTLFLRPTQSEKLLLEFGDLAVVERGQLHDFWPVLPT